MCKQKQFTDKTTHRQQVNIVLRACLILHDILTPKFNLWIYVGVMECRSLFSATVTLISGSGLEKMHPQQIAYIIYGSNSIFGMQIHLGPWRVTKWFQVTLTLTSGLSSRKVEPRAYLYIIGGKNPKFGVRIYFGIIACRIHFWVSLT